MDRETIEQALAALKGVTFIGLDTVTTPVLKGGKKNPFQGKVQKLCHGHRIILYGSPGYEAKVKRHLEAEGKDPDSFTAKPLPWGEHVKGTAFIEHKGELYLQCVFIAAGSVEYRATEDIEVSPIFFWESGMTIPKQEIIGLNERSGSEHQGLENEVIVRAYKLSSITGLRAFGEVLA